MIEPPPRPPPPPPVRARHGQFFTGVLEKSISAVLKFIPRFSNRSLPWVTEFLDPAPPPQPSRPTLKPFTATGERHRSSSISIGNLMSPLPPLLQLHVRCRNPQLSLSLCVLCCRTVFHLVTPDSIMSIYLKSVSLGLAPKDMLSGEALLELTAKEESA